MEKNKLKKSSSVRTINGTRIIKKTFSIKMQDVGTSQPKKY